MVQLPSTFRTYPIGSLVWPIDELLAAPSASSPIICTVSRILEERIDIELSMNCSATKRPPLRQPARPIIGIRLHQHDARCSRR